MPIVSSCTFHPKELTAGSEATLTFAYTVPEGTSLASATVEWGSSIQATYTKAGGLKCEAGSCSVAYIYSESGSYDIYVTTLVDDAGNIMREKSDCGYAQVSNGDHALNLYVSTVP